MLIDSVTIGFLRVLIGSYRRFVMGGLNIHLSGYDTK